MTGRSASSTSPDRLRSALTAIPGHLWSLPSTFVATGVHHGYRRVVLVEAGNHLPVGELFRCVLDDFAPVWSAWLSWIEPGGFIVAHRDGGPYRDRWQVPIVAGDMSGQPTEAGVPFQVQHWEPHWVRNDTDQPRVHLVIDRDEIVNPIRTPFTLEA